MRRPRQARWLRRRGGFREVLALPNRKPDRLGSRDSGRPIKRTNAGQSCCVDARRGPFHLLETREVCLGVDLLPAF